MASILDIPLELRNPDQAPNMIQWLATIPLPRETRIALARIWERHTQARFNPEQWAIVSATPDDKH